MINEIALPVHPDCFVCDSTNPMGIGVQWFGQPDHRSIRGTVTLTQTYVGPPNHAHGGASAAVLDDAMGTCAWFAGHQVMTAKMTVNYRRPVPLDTPLQVAAAVEKVDGRKIYINAQIHLPDGTVATESDGLFIVIPEAFLDDASGRFAGMKAYASEVNTARDQASS
ncbi:MAG: PaaI family thioesterase [Candidatus Promineifilaceae bacterium]